MTTSGFETRSPTAGRAVGPSGNPTQQGRSIGWLQITTSFQEHQAASVVRSVRAARANLLAAQFGLDDAGYSCRRLDDLLDGTAALLADWAGRRRPGFGEALPAYVMAAAIEWRRMARRSY